MREPNGHGTLLNLDCGGCYTDIHMIKLNTTTHTYEYKCLDCTNVKFLVSVLYLSCAKGYHQGKLGEG